MTANLTSPPKRTYNVTQMVFLPTRASPAHRNPEGSRRTKKWIAGDAR
eukprot:CAMPEP_0114686350 /NCGR_PEP_ID=MMETSP0191-20121206/61420_1 /TAXON_ID=126664 /ORGANISM="Sorites sp." /LENGTH=47 /DNA_ID= /DNA_START= /DNA_END= /DNA_ORIENTATION=